MYSSITFGLLPAAWIRVALGMNVGMRAAPQETGATEKATQRVAFLLPRFVSLRNRRKTRITASPSPYGMALIPKTFDRFVFASGGVNVTLTICTWLLVWTMVS